MSEQVKEKLRREVKFWVVSCAVAAGYLAAAWISA
jgi:hypothetical protein